MAERRIADAIALAAVHLRRQPVPGVVDLLEQAAVPQRVEQPKAQTLAEAGAFDHVAEPQHLAARLECAQNF